MLSRIIFSAIVTCQCLLHLGTFAYADQTWTFVTDPPSGRGGANQLPSAVRLQDGRVLVMVDSNQNSVLFNPVTASWSVAAQPLYGVRYYLATATLLADGRVLVAGGNNTSGQLSGNEVEIYNPVSDTWVQAASLLRARTPYNPVIYGAHHTATLLQDGRVLGVGGCLNTSNPHCAELYNPSTDTWTPAANTNHPRSDHAAVLLNDGRVLVVGDRSTPYSDPIPVEIYDPSTNTWTIAASLPPEGRAHSVPTATLLRDGRVLVQASTSTESNTGERIPVPAHIYNPLNDSWNATPPKIWQDGADFSVLLTDGTVLVAGIGNCGNETGGYAQIYHPAANFWAPAPSMNVPRATRAVVLLDDGGVLVVGGAFTMSESFAERFDQTPVLAGGRATIDGFAGFGGVVSTKSTTLPTCVAGREVPLIIYSAVNGETVDPGTLQLVFNGIPVSLLTPLPAQGLAYAVVTLQPGRNVLVSSIEGIVPGTTRTASDSDHVTIIVK